jgi:hypothetical protein
MLSNVLGNTARSAGGTSYKNYFDFKYFLANSAATPKLIGAKEGAGRSVRQTRTLPDAPAPSLPANAAPEPLSASPSVDSRTVQALPAPRGVAGGPDLLSDVRA